jgi:hypothetical protein
MKKTRPLHPNIVMAGHSRPKDGVASARLCPAIHVFGSGKQDVDARDKRGHDERIAAGTAGENKKAPVETGA